ncbi:MAG: CotH kinase family protein [Verrucomicrobiota bacterium]
MTPKRVPRVPKLFQSDGTIVLRNPKAQRSGLAGSLGYDFVWTHGTLEFAGVTWTNVGCRYRGNGTFLHYLYGPKRPLKVELDKFEKKQALAGVRTLNLANLTVDSSYLSDALGYELFRAAGVPAPRTAYVWLTVTAAGQFARQPFGLYLLIEDLDPAFAEDRFGSKRTAIFKPVTYDLFQDLGRDWSAYERIYDPKTKLSNDQKERVIAFAQLLTHANDSEFARQVGEFLDLDEFARFLAGLVLLSSYDGFLSNGQNFYMYLDPRSEKFGFIPWDLDHAWGAFPFVGLPETREQASIWRPWSSRNRLLERVLAVGEFRRLYRDRLDDLLSHHFVPDQLNHRIDEIAQIIRAPIAAENDYRFKRFEEATSMTWNQRSHGNEDGPTAPVHQIKRFIQNRALAVRDQLDGKAKGVEFAVRGPDERR